MEQQYLHPFSKVFWLHRLCIVALVLSICASSVPSVYAQNATVTPDTASTVAITVTNSTTVTDSTTVTTVSTPANPVPIATASSLDEQVEFLFQKMSIADKVGQIFVISFQGPTADYESDILELIYGYRVGGVVLSPRYGNFTNAKGADTPRQVAVLANQLQATAYGVVLTAGRELEPIPNQPWPPPTVGLLRNMEGLSDTVPVEVPLLIGIEEGGDNLNTATLRRRFTELPSQLAIGSTWDPKLAHQVGKIVGSELRAVGVNLLLGPNLEVIDSPRSDRVGALATDSFGGNPYWVSQMARAYISGVHHGGEGRVATIARHFPGQGNADRLPDEEISTIQKTRKELEQTEFPPFLAVTTVTNNQQNVSGMTATLAYTDNVTTTDGLMSSHMRFPGLQGNDVSPFSLSNQFDLFLEQTGLSEWRTAGGLMMSDSLGAPAIRQFYSTASGDFPARQIAQTALTAGHDLLYLDRFAIDGDWASELVNIRDTIVFFQSEYSSDANLAAQIDASVRRILRLKLRLYSTPGVAAPMSTSAGVEQQSPLIPLSQVLVQEAHLQMLTDDAQEAARLVVNQVARSAITLLAPDPQLQTDAGLAPPQSTEKLLIFTDSRLMQECESCAVEAAIGPGELARIIERFYGPEEGTGQINSAQVTSLTFSELNEWLKKQQTLTSTEEGQPPPSALEAAQSITVNVPVTANLSIPDVAAAANPEATSTITESLPNTGIAAQIAEAHWIIFAMLDVDENNQLHSEAIKRFLNWHNDKFNDKQIIVLALAAPLFLDDTEVSKLDAYYGVYSRGTAFLESAVRAIFRRFTPDSAPAISVPGTRFDNLADRLQPDQTSPFKLRVWRNTEIIAQSETEGLALSGIDDSIEVSLTDRIRLEAGPLLDRNGHIIADNSVVQFRFEVIDNTESTPYLLEAVTVKGMASQDFVAERAGTVRVTASLGAASSGAPLDFTVLPAPVAVAAVATQPVIIISETPTAAVTASPTVQADPSLLDSVPNPNQRVNPVTLMLSLLTMIVMLSLVVLVQVRLVPRRTLVSSLCWAVITGLGAYITYGLGWLPSGAWLSLHLKVLAAPFVVFVGMWIPLLWVQLRELDQHRREMTKVRK